jgi:hypothetical protein
MSLNQFGMRRGLKYFVEERWVARVRERKKKKNKKR